MTDIASVIGWRFDHQEVMATVDGVITEFPGGIPSESDQDGWRAEYEAHLAAMAYSELRAASYPSWQEQKDMQYWDAVNGTTTWHDTIAAVKDAHPKPSE